MDIQEYIDKRVGTWVYETTQLGYQCVAQVKDYCLNVLGIRLWSFWGSALTWWENLRNTFPDNIWEKISYNNNEPIAWDIIFFSWYDRRYWHTGVVIKTVWDQIEIINQNVGNGDGRWSDDYIKISLRDYSNVLGWYRHRESSPYRFVTSYKGFPVVRLNRDYKKIIAFYSLKNKRICLYSRFFTKDIERQAIVLEHEYAHCVYFNNIPEKYIKFWEWINDWRFIPEINRRTWRNYKLEYLYEDPKERIASEEFAEIWETLYQNPNPWFTGYLWIKCNVVKVLMGRYGGF